MNSEIIKLDGSEIKPLAEFSAAETAYENAQAQYGADFYRIGLLNGFVIISTKDEVGESDLKKRLQTIKNGNEKQKLVMTNWMKRDWWNVALAFEADACGELIDRLEQVYDLKPSQNLDFNKFEIIRGRDEMGVRINSVMPHNAGKPIVTLQIVNHRALEIGGLNSTMWQLITTPETGRKLLNELRNLKPEISAFV